ncbi:MAG: serine/threonine protein kinase [Deltaproteobacteria bacterium]|nr:serine/threonine protein kinase [Deltaproteobacteria bacterium]
MAELFLAKQVGMEGFEKVVALKRILAHLAYDEEFINMFRDEARIVAKLSHPNIVQIYDLGKSDDSYFIAMEYIPGRNLSSIAKKARSFGEKMPSGNVARCMAQACEGLHYAHTRQDLDGAPLGIVHRDVSPQNIIVAFSGGVKLVDFGIAKAATKIQQTRAGVLKGKYAYMSPEQIRGERIDARSDLFSVGIVIYELLAGRRPFEKDNSIQTLKAIVQDRHADVRTHNAEVPNELVRIIDRCLEKKVGDRYQSAQEVQVDLEDFCASSGVRVNNVVISDWLKRLFADELARDKGSTIVFKDVGPVILPDVSSDPDSNSSGGARAEPSYSTGRLPAPELEVEVDMSPSDDLPRGRGGGSVERAASRGSSAGRSKLLEEGKIEHDQADDGDYDDRETAIAAEASEGDTRLGAKPTSRTGGSAAADPADAPRPSDPAEEFRSESTVEAYGEDELPAAVKPTGNLYDDSQTEFSGTKPKRPEAVPEVQVLDPSERGRKAKARVPTPRTPAPALQLEDDDADPWGDRTAHDEPGPTPDLPLPSLGDYVDTLGGDAVDSDWSERTSAGAIPDMDAAQEPQVSASQDLWGDKTAAADEGDQTGLPMAEVEDIAEAAVVLEPVGARSDEETTGDGRDDRAYPRADTATDTALDTSDDRDFVDGPTELADDPESSAIDDEDALPAGIDLSRNVDADSATVAGTASDFVGAGLAVPSLGTYEPKVQPQPAPQRPPTALGGIKLQKVAAVPRGGIRESVSSVERSIPAEIQGADVDADFGESPTLGADPDDRDELPLPKAASRVEPRRKKPAFGAEEPTDFGGLTGEDPAASPLSPKVPAPLSAMKVPKGPMGIGSTQVPPANVSLSEMLVDPNAKSGYGRDFEKKSASNIRGTPMTGVRGASLSVEGPIVAEPAPPPPPPRAAKSITVRQIRESQRSSKDDESARASQQLPTQPIPIPHSQQPVAPFVGQDVIQLAPLAPVGGPRMNILPVIAAALLVLAVVAVAAVVVLKLRSKPALLIESDPTGAIVVVDDNPLPGRTPVEMGEVVENQQYKVRVELPGFLPQTKLVRIPSGSGRSHVKFGLEKSPASTAEQPPQTPTPPPGPPPGPAPDPPKRLEPAPKPAAPSG